MLLLIIFILIHHGNSAINCVDIHVSIAQNIENNGFHSKISWMLELQSPDLIMLQESNLQFALHVNVPSGMFINTDEVSDLIRLGKLFVYIDRDINVEATENDSEHHNVVIYVMENLDRRMVLMLPVHLRYQLAQIGGGFRKVQVPKPSLLVFSDEINICTEYLPVEAPCDYKNLQACTWRNISYEAEFDEISLDVPIGNVDHFPIVIVSTLVLGCIGCMYILSILFAHHHGK